MSWLSSAFEGNFKPLTSGIANVTGISKTPLAQIGGKNTVKDLEIGGGLALGGLGLAGLAGLGPAAGLLGGTGEALGFGGIGEALGFGGAAEAAGGAGALAPGSLDALSATGNLAGAVPAGASAAGVAAPSGIGSALGLAADPTAAAANPLSDISSLGGYNSIDAAAGQPGINGFAGAAPIDGQAVVNNAAQLSGAGGNAPAQGGSFLLASGLGDSIAKNPLGVALGAGGRQQ